MTCITNGIQLAVILIVVSVVDRFGRRNICCGGLTTMLVGDCLIGILGVIKQNKATEGLLVFFSVIYSEWWHRFGITSLQLSACNALALPGGDSSGRSRLNDFVLTPQDLPQHCPVSWA